MLPPEAHPPNRLLYWFAFILGCILGFITYALFNQAYADEYDWSRADVNREIAFQLGYFYDLQQNLTALKAWQHQETHTLSPSIVHNPYLGYRSDENAITHYFLATGLMHWAISAMLPSDWRRGWQWLTIGYVGSDIHQNMMLGYRVRF